MTSQLADQAVALSQPGVKLPFNEFAKGLAEYRRGNYEAAVEWMRKALDASEVSFRDAQAYLVLALAQHQLSHVGEARQALAYRLDIIDTQAPKLKSGDLGQNWSDWIIARSLANEARTLINGGTTRAESTNP